MRRLQPSAMPNSATAIQPYVGTHDGVLELIKFVALASMLADHVGRYAMGASLESAAFAAGRLAFPLFGYVLAVNLSRPGNVRERCARTARRLVVWCLLSLLPSAWARGDVLPINIFATLAIATTMCGLVASESQGARAIVAWTCLFLSAIFVEFSLIGVAWMVTVFLWRTHSGSVVLRLGPIVSIGLLATLNASYGGASAALMTLAAPFFVLLAPRLGFRVPRYRQLFYVLYPLHLVFIGAWNAVS